LHRRRTVWLQLTWLHLARLHLRRVGGGCGGQWRRSLLRRGLDRLGGCERTTAHHQ